MHFTCGTWCVVQWDDLGQSFWGTTLDMAPVSGVGFAPLELDHAARVHWEPLELDGGAWYDVVPWDDSASYFSLLYIDGFDMEKATGW